MEEKGFISFQRELNEYLSGSIPALFQGIFDTITIIPRLLLALLTGP